MNKQRLELAHRYRYSLRIASIHACLWPFTTAFMFACVYATTTAVIDGLFVMAILPASLSVGAIYQNVTGIQACWQCKVNNLDWNKDWRKQ